MIFKRKQVVVLALVLMIVVAGYLQYSYKKSSLSTSAEKDNNKIGEAAYVVNNQNDPIAKNTANDKNTTKKTVAASKEATNFFAQAKMDRESTRSKNTETLEGITKDENAEKAVKADAYKKMINLTAVTEKEMKIEALIKKAGFEDALVMYADNGGFDIVIKAPSLTSQQVTQIADIASRQGNVADISKIVVSIEY